MDGGVRRRGRNRREARGARMKLASVYSWAFITLGVLLVVSVLGYIAISFNPMPAVPAHLPDPRVTENRIECPSDIKGKTVGELLFTNGEAECLFNLMAERIDLLDAKGRIYP